MEEQNRSHARKSVISHSGSAAPCSRATIGFFLSAVILLIWQLFIPPVLSVADDNDFQKLAGRYCLGQDPRTGPVLFDYTNLHWRLSDHACIDWPQRTAAEAPFVLAMGLNRVSGSRSEFDLRWMGAVYGALFIAGFFWLQHVLAAAPRTFSLVFQGSYLLAICNAVYIPWFNTFYFDALTLACLTGAVAGLCVVTLRPDTREITIVISGFWLALVAGSKSQHAPVALLAIPLFWLPLIRLRRLPVWPRAVSTALIVAGAAVSLGTVPASYRGMAPFNVLFYRILPGVPEPARYIAETRIPPAWLRYIGQHTFTPNSPLATAAGQAKFAEWFDPTDLIRFYIRHPQFAWRLAEINLTEGSRDRVRMRTGAIEHRLGNYERSSQKPPQSLSYFFCIWPVIKEAAIAGRPCIYLTWILIVLCAAWTLAPRIPGIRLVLTFFSGAMVVAWGITMLDGLDAGRHLLIFNFLLDLLVCADVSLLIERLQVRRNR